MAFKTLQNTASQADVQSGDILAVARGSGALSHVLVSAFVTYLNTVYQPIGSYAVTSTTVTGAGLVTGGGDLSANRTLTVTAALAADVRGGSDITKAVTSGALMSSSAFQTLTDAATIAWNCANGYNATVTLTASGHTIGAPTGLYDGLGVSLEIVQDATGSRTVNWNAIWDFGGAGLPVLQLTANKADRIFGQYNARTGKIECSFRKGA